LCRSHAQPTQPQAQQYYVSISHNKTITNTPLPGTAL
jgi:hypothetical protein